MISKIINARISNRNFSGKSNQDILPQHTFIRRLIIKLAQVKAGNTPENLINRLEELHIHCVKQNKFTSRDPIISQCEDSDGHTIYKFREQII